MKRLDEGSGIYGNDNNLPKLRFYVIMLLSTGKRHE